MSEFNSRRLGIKSAFAVAALPLVYQGSANGAPAATPIKAADIAKSVLTPKGWTWHEPHGFVWGRVAKPGSRTIYVSGQSSVDGAGNILHKGDMGAQLVKSVENLELVLAEAGATLAHVVSVTYYTTSIDQFFAGMDKLTAPLAKAGCKPTSTLLEVKRLYHPDILFEFSSVAVV